jgi:hypothetical protein
VAVLGGIQGFIIVALAGFIFSRNNLNSIMFITKQVALFIIALLGLITTIMLSCVMRKKLRGEEVEFGFFEILYFMAFAGFVSGIGLTWDWIPPNPHDGPAAAHYAHFLAMRVPRPSFAGQLTALSSFLLFITVPACLAGWLSKTVSPDWEETALRKAKYCGAFAGFCALVLGALVIPNDHPANYIWDDACINHLRLIDSAKQQWALEHRAQSTDTPSASDLQPYMGRGTAGSLDFFCSEDPNQSFATSYSINNIATKPTCKISPLTHVLP